MLLWAPRGILDQSPGLYHREQIDEVTGRLDHLQAVLIPGTNHYTILTDDVGAGAGAEAVLAAIEIGR